MTLNSHHLVIKMLIKAFTVYTVVLSEYMGIVIQNFSFTNGSIVKFQIITYTSQHDYIGKIYQSDILWPTKDIT